MPYYSVPAQDDLVSAGSDRRPLPGNEDYKARVLEIGLSQKKDYNGVDAEFYTVKFGITSFADGAALEDVDGNPVDGERWIWRDIDSRRRGFMQSGVASMFRQFFLSANGISDMTDRIPSGDTDDLIGREVVLSLTVYPGRDGRQRNKIVAIKPITRRRGTFPPPPPAPPAEPPAIEPAEVSDEFAATLASLIEGTDAPTAEQIASAKATAATIS